MNERTTHRHSGTAHPAALIPGCCIALLVGMAAGLVLLMLSAAFVYAQPDPSVLGQPLALLSLYLSALICGFAAAKLTRQGIVSGAVSGVLLILVKTALSFLPPLSGGGLSVPVSVLAHIGIAAAAVLGSLAGKERRPVPGKRTKKRLR